MTENEQLNWTEYSAFVFAFIDWENVWISVVSQMNKMIYLRILLLSRTFNTPIHTLKQKHNHFPSSMHEKRKRNQSVRVTDSACKLSDWQLSMRVMLCFVSRVKVRKKRGWVPSGSTPLYTSLLIHRDLFWSRFIDSQFHLVSN